VIEFKQSHHHEHSPNPSTDVPPHTVERHGSRTGVAMAGSHDAKQSQSVHAQSPKRMAFLFMPNGVRADQWTPEGEGTDFKLSKTLSPLEALKDKLLIPPIFGIKPATLEMVIM
jgi:hypothetical protein